MPLINKNIKNKQKRTAEFVKAKAEKKKETKKRRAAREEERRVLGDAAPPKPVYPQTHSISSFFFTLFIFIII